MQVPTFRKITAGQYIDDVSGVQIARGDSRSWYVYTVVPGEQRDNLRASRATLAEAKVAARGVIRKLADLREADHAEAFANEVFGMFASVATGQPQQLRDWMARHGLDTPNFPDADAMLAAFEADRAEALEMNAPVKRQFCAMHMGTASDYVTVDLADEAGTRRFHYCRDCIEKAHVAALAVAAQQNAPRAYFKAERDRYIWAGIGGAAADRGALVHLHAEALRYDAYRTELRTELGKFARGEEPYPYWPTLVITEPLTHAGTVDEIRIDWKTGRRTTEHALRAIRNVTGVTPEGASALLYAESTASLADLR